MAALGLDRTRLLLEDGPVAPAAEEKIWALARRRAQGEPVRYLTGVCPFMDLEFYVDSATLIPRPETELLVEAVEQRLPPGPLSLWDVGCGSGCIGISLAWRNPNLRVTAIDVSPEALRVAEANVRRWGMEERVALCRHDILTGPPKLPPPDAVVSNPPYIPTGALSGLQREVREYEPRAALDGGPDGLRFYRRLIADMPLGPGGILALEIGYDQGETVPALLRAGGYTRVELLRDLAGQPRVALGYFPKGAPPL